jgi:hypothetical protein
MPPRTWRNNKQEPWSDSPRQLTSHPFVGIHLYYACIVASPHGVAVLPARSLGARNPRGTDPALVRLH